MTAKKEARRKRALERFSVNHIKARTVGGYLGRKRAELVVLGGDLSYFDAYAGKGAS